MEHMVRMPAAGADTASAPVVYQSKLQPGRIVFGVVAAVSAAIATALLARGAAGKMAGWALAAALVFFSFKRRRVVLDPAQNLLAESERYLLAGKTKKMKLSEYGSISVAVQANDNDAEDGDFLSLFEVYAVGNGKPPILVFASQDRPVVEREVEFLAGRLKWVVGWHSRSYGD